MSTPVAARRWNVIAIAAAVLLGVLVVVDYRYGLIFVLAAAFAALFLTQDRLRFPFVVLGIALVVPFDFVAAFSDDLRGLPVLAVAIGGVALSFLAPARPIGEVARSGWDVWVFMGSLLLTFGINGVSGGVRQALMLVAGVLFYVWVRLSNPGGDRARTLLLRTLLVVGVIQGVGAIVERIVGVSVVSGAIPGYAPAVKDFTLALGGRAVAFAGHPLRLGALEMSAIIAGFGLSKSVMGRERVLDAAGIAVCAVGLLLSGARGAWLGTFVGVIAMLVLTPGPESPRLAFRLTVVSVVGWIVLSAAGALELIQQSLFGAASRPASIAQRAGVLASSLDIWRQRPIQGYGFGTYLEQIFAQGFRFSNTENEYVNFLLSGGLIAFSGWLLMGARGVMLAVRGRGLYLMPAVGGLLIAWLVNVGTYNAFSWSTGFPAFMTILAVAADGADE